MNEVETKDNKKISFFSALLIVIGGSIGAGIFFKSGGVLSNSHSSIILAAFCWIIASLAVIAMALALIEISSVRNDNLSLLGWTKVFCGRKLYLSSKNFMTYIYLPFTYFFMPLYVILSLQDGFTGLLGRDANFGTSHDWIIWLVIALIMSVYFLTVPAIWSKVGDAQNKIVLAVKFLPLIFVPVIGIVLAITGHGGTDNVSVALKPAEGSFSHLVKTGTGITSFAGVGAGLGVFLAVSAIFFAYDGFYVAAGIQSEMKEPRKTPLAIFLGLAITTVIYLIIAIAMSINGGSFFAMQDYMASLFHSKRAAQIMFGLMNLCIAIGVLGIINGFSMWAPRYVEDLLALGDLPYWNKYKNKLNPNRPIVGIVYSLVLTIPLVIIFMVIGALAYLPLNADYAFYDSPTDWKALSTGAGGSMQRLYSFADLMANWTALFTFAYIAFAILGGIINRKTGKIQIADKKSYFVPAAWISVIIVMIALVVTVLQPIIDLFLLFGFDSHYTAVDAAQGSVDVLLSDVYDLKAGTAQTLLNQANTETVKQIALTFGGKDVSLVLRDIIVGRVALVVTLVIFILLSFLPTAIEDRKNKKAFGSLEKYEEWKAQQLAGISSLAN
ncbi:APC family permease [Mycoplasmopsis opalescens]|uniref:APC family permease n=1 Tax=Mycoplasmopsis opalescens TaxID=114886 RepID=UPI0005667507|nr:APC family permease [Mycoplasmopsis opalescens]